MNKIGLNTARLNTALLNVAYTNGFPVLSKRSGSSADISQAIMDSLVCWYDPGKQQCTNESMAANPVLADLSGNGHDIECFNFGWSGMSGIGGYKVNFNEFSVTNNSSVKEYTYNKLVVYNTEDVNTNFWDFFNNLAPGETYHIDSYKVRISGLSDEETIRYRYYNLNDDNSTSHIVIFLRNGINTIPEINMTSITGIVDMYTTAFQYFLNEIINKQITIELLPEYPNALVSDGVDDYCYTDGLPILTDYTVIAKRSYQGFEQNLQDNNIALAGKTTSSENGAFMLERLLKSGEYSEYNFGRHNGITLHNDIITYATKDSYNGVQKLNAGELPDTDKLFLFTKARYNSVVQAALYSFLLFDRTLTTAEIEWVKKNMIEGDLVLPSYELDPSLIDAWILSGHTNEEAPTQITGEKGTALNCHNFAWNEEGSGFKDGYLCFDGVDDRLSTYKHLPLLKTVIAKYVIPKQTYKNYACVTSFADVPNRSTMLSAYDLGLSNTQLVSSMSGYGYLLHDVAQEEVHTDYLNTYGRNGEPYIENNTTEMKDTYQITMGCVFNNIAYMQAKIAYVAIYSESLTDAECMMEIEKLEKIWSNRLNNNKS